MGAELVVTHLHHVGWRWLPPMVDRGEPLVAWAAPQPAMKAAAMATQVVIRVFATSLTRRAGSQSGHVIDDAHRHDGARAAKTYSEGEMSWISQGRARW